MIGRNPGPAEARNMAEMALAGRLRDLGPRSTTRLSRNRSEPRRTSAQPPTSARSCPPDPTSAITWGTLHSILIPSPCWWAKKITAPSATTKWAWSGRPAVP